MSAARRRVTAREPGNLLMWTIEEWECLYGLRGAARKLRVDPGYLSRLRSGAKTNPDDALLKKLGLRRVVTYEWATRLPKRGKTRKEIKRGR